MEQNVFMCPLLQKAIEEGECYDVQMVRAQMIKEAVLKEPFDRQKADVLCPFCVFNPLPAQSY